MSVESLEFWKDLFEISGVVLLLLTFIAGAGVLLFSRKLNSRQAAQLRQFDKDLTDAKTKLGEQQERAAAAEKALKVVDIKTEGFRLAIANANERAGKAQESLALAEQHAAEANAKAEGFRLDIAQANERTATAELELAKIKTPRSLTDIPQLIAALEPFKNTEYMFSGVFADEESINTLKQLDAVLQRAEWKNVGSPGGFPSISVYGKDRNMSVQASLRTGIRISVSSIETGDSLRSKPLAELPRYIQAAIALNSNLPSHIAPPQDLPDGNFVNVTPGGLTCVQIDVGKKP